MGLSFLTCNMETSSDAPHHWVIKGLFETKHCHERLEEHKKLTQDLPTGQTQD